MKKSILLLTAVASFAANANQSLRPEAILVEDVEYKLARGFKADDVVYRLPEAAMKSDTKAVKGGGTTIRQGYMGGEFIGRESDFEYGSSGQGNIYRTSPSESFADVHMEIPDGNEFTFVRVWGLDSNAAENMTFFVFERCLPSFGSGPITQTTLGEVEVDTSAGEFTGLISIPADTFIDTEQCTYATRVRFDDTGSSLQVYKVRAQSDIQL